MNSKKQLREKKSMKKILKMRIIMKMWSENAFKEKKGGDAWD